MEHVLMKKLDLSIIDGTDDKPFQFIVWQLPNGVIFVPGSDETSHMFYVHSDAVALHGVDWTIVDCEVLTETLTLSATELSDMIQTFEVSHGYPEVMCRLQEYRRVQV